MPAYRVEIHMKVQEDFKVVHSLEKIVDTGDEARQFGEEVKEIIFEFQEVFMPKGDGDG